MLQENNVHNRSIWCLFCVKVFNIPLSIAIHSWMIAIITLLNTYCLFNVPSEYNSWMLEKLSFMLSFSRVRMLYSEGPLNKQWVPSNVYDEYYWLLNVSFALTLVHPTHTHGLKHISFSQASMAWRTSHFLQRLFQTTRCNVWGSLHTWDWRPVTIAF